MTDLLGHSVICHCASSGPLLLFARGSGPAGAALDREGRFNGEEGFAPRRTEILSDVNSQVGVERFQLFGEQLIGQGVEAIRAPAQPGPFQKVKSRAGNISCHICELFSH